MLFIPSNLLSALWHFVRIPISKAKLFLHCVLRSKSSLWANDTGHLSPSWIDWTWQWTTPDLNRIEQSLVLCCSSNCDLRCLIQTNIAAAKMRGGRRVSSIWGNQISCVLGGPAVRTLCSCWNHECCGSTSHVANCTRCRVIIEWITAVVALREYVSTTISRSEDFVFYSGNFSSGSLESSCIVFPLRFVWKTQKVAAAANFGITCSCCVSFLQHKDI